MRPNRVKEKLLAGQIATIEEIRAVKSLPEILTVDHIDVFFVASSDLALTMGYTGQMHHPEVIGVVEGAIQQIVAAGRVAGALVSDDSLERSLNLGAQFILTTFDGWLNAGAQRYLSRVAEFSLTARER